MPKVSVVMPIYNVEDFVAVAIKSVLQQSFSDFELLIIDDRSPDNSLEICHQFSDHRIKIISHSENKGLAAARNTGVNQASGEYIAFLDSDDFWHKDKLRCHVEHLTSAPDIGVSFSRSIFVDQQGNSLNCFQMPKMTDIEPGYLMCRNPVGNGSAAVIRREVFDELQRPNRESIGDDVEYFDETLRRSEDIECWIRIAITTDWKFAGLPEPLTNYRLNAGGLSAELFKQLESWEKVVEITKAYAPDFITQWETPAKAYQERYLARQAIRLQDGKSAKHFVRRSIRRYPKMLIEEPGRSVATLIAAYLLAFAPRLWRLGIDRIGQKFIGKIQALKISREVQIGSV